MGNTIKGAEPEAGDHATYLLNVKNYEAVRCVGT